jgi:uncharacterized protein (TIGR02996 family)
MRTFEYRDAKSAKFWGIELKGNSFTVTFGRIGTAGQTQTKTFPDEARAQKEHDKLLAEKLAKGYVETAPAARASPTQKALEQALADNPDDRAAHAAYADYLAEQGDPRGELIQTQLALEGPGRAPAERRQLQKREQDLLKQHAPEWLGELAPYLLDQEGYDYQFARGWLDSLQIRSLSVAFARVLAGAPQARLLRRLVIEGNVYTEPEEYEPGPDVPEGESYPGLYPLRKAPWLGSVRVFRLGEQAEEGPGYSCWTSGDAAVDLVKQMPRLEELYLFAHVGEPDLKTLFGLKTLTHLRVLVVYHNGETTEHPLATLARNASLGRLTDLRIHPHGSSGHEQGSSLPVSQVRALVRSPHLTGLTRLQLRLSNMGDAGCREIVDSGILKRLKVLDLSYGCITDGGARTLAGSPDLRHLESLDVSRNWLTEAGVEALEAVGIKVEAGGQSPEGDDGYLMEGDME